ncbi:ABC transporter permease [Clostridium sp. YIM B02505]|uniref:ABC transporter permease n=1 Tax=Clostridium yunnanense TaxID=2800325 RepID=A0ABS1ETY8_9CLOT|nr:ABC transporter permease [Clostridium yunnanense]MBK1812780.1 ABC transporter permease [Clostridium yunnanense]
MNILNIFKNNLSRTLAQKATIIIALILIPIMIGAAVLFSEKVVIKGKIAYVSATNISIPKDNRVDIEILKEKPAVSSLLIGKYVAIVEKRNDDYIVTTLKNQKDKRIIEAYFKTGKLPDNNEDTSKKGEGTNILGFILMILLMQGVALITLYTEDRDKKTLRRILMSPANERIYLFTQELFTFSGIFIPSYLTLAVTKIVFKVDMGFSYGMLFILVAIISALSTSLALFIASVLGSDYSLASTGIYMLTSLVSGCYISFTDGNKFLDILCSALPQKAYMTMIQGIEKGKSLSQFTSQLIYLFIWIAAAYLLGSAINKRKIKQGIY